MHFAMKNLCDWFAFATANFEFEVQGRVQRKQELAEPGAANKVG